MKDLGLLQSGSGQNMLFSPLTLTKCLSLMADASDVQTKEQIQEMIGSADMLGFENIDGVLNACSAIFVNSRLASQLNADFVNDVCIPSGIEVITDSFGSVDGINQWFTENTFGMIPTAVSNVTPDIDVIISSVLALDMPWAENYFGTSYGGYPFYLSDGREISVPKLEIGYPSVHVGLKEADGLTVISLDLKAYADLQFEAVILMAEDLEQYVSSHSYDEVLADATGLTPLSDFDEPVCVMMPSFHMDYELDLKKALMDAGVRAIFDSKSMNLPQMFDEGGYVSDIIQHSSLYFNEKGIRAASYTSGIVMVYGMEEEKRTICIDHPFVFMLRDKKTGVVLFIGTVYEPDGYNYDETDDELMDEYDDDEYTGDELGCIDVNITAIGDGIAIGGGKYTPGEMVVLKTVEDGGIFEGWYSAEQLVSTEATYSFICQKESNIEFEARFTKVESITLSDTEMILQKGKTKVLSASVLPENATNSSVKWSSDDETVATVENGIVKGVGEGCVNITASIGNVSQTCTVTVVKDIIGDINQDGIFDIQDVFFAKEIAVKNPQVQPTEEGVKASDLNGDGKITINEVRKIMRVVLGETSF